jgi:hypothetical protein
MYQSPLHFELMGGILVHEWGGGEMLARDWLTQSRQKGKDPFWRGFYVYTHTYTKQRGRK